MQNFNAPTPIRQAYSAQASLNALALAKGTGAAYDYEQTHDGFLFENDDAYFEPASGTIVLPCVGNCGTILRGDVEETEDGPTLVISDDTPGATVDRAYGLCALCAGAPQILAMAA